jgi:predicted RNA-binding protein (virulence factor B family)
LFAPLRMLVYRDSDGNAIFTMDRPSDGFGSLGIAEVTKVGQGLDRKVVNLLRVIGVDAEQVFD